MIVNTASLLSGCWNTPTYAVKNVVNAVWKCQLSLYRLGKKPQVEQNTGGVWPGKVGTHFKCYSLKSNRSHYVFKKKWNKVLRVLVNGQNYLISMPKFLGNSLEGLKSFWKNFLLKRKNTGKYLHWFTIIMSLTTGLEFFVASSLVWKCFLFFAKLNPSMSTTQIWNSEITPPHALETFQPCIFYQIYDKSVFFKHTVSTKVFKQIPFIN